MKTTEITFAITIRVSGNPVPYRPATGGEVEDMKIEFPRKFNAMASNLGEEILAASGVYEFLDLVADDWRKKAEEALLTRTATRTPAMRA